MSISLSRTLKQEASTNRYGMQVSIDPEKNRCNTGWDTGIHSKLHHFVYTTEPWRGFGYYWGDIWQLAGAFYGEDAISALWRERWAFRELIEDVAERLYVLNQKYKQYICPCSLLRIIWKD